MDVNKEDYKNMYYYRVSYCTLLTAGSFRVKITEHRYWIIRKPVTACYWQRIIRTGSGMQLHIAMQCVLLNKRNFCQSRAWNSNALQKPNPPLGRQPDKKNMAGLSQHLQKPAICLSWATRIQNITSQTTAVRSILILSFPVCLRLKNNRFPSRLPIKIFHAFLLPRKCPISCLSNPLCFAIRASTQNTNYKPPSFHTFIIGWLNGTLSNAAAELVRMPPRIPDIPGSHLSPQTQSCLSLFPQLYRANVGMTSSKRTASLMMVLTSPKHVGLWTILLML
jgi:hypothetical protein